MFFLGLEWGCWFFETKTRNVSERIILITHIKGICYLHDLSLLILTFLTWLRWCLLDSSIVELFFISLLYHILWKGVSFFLGTMNNSSSLCSAFFALRSKTIIK